MNQQMADLPSCRLDDSLPPFSHVGVDYFGHFFVKVGRKSVKKYAVVFTCMVARAIHLEIASSLDASSFINALRRFVSRRGPVSFMYSDNGTNFVGTCTEFKKALGEMNPKLHEWAVNSQIEWSFNPPHASHMGGAWERQIKTIRQVLFGLMVEFSFILNEDTLHTFMCEAENIVNSRPLTTVSDSPDDLEALTPNHILTLKTKVNVPPGNFQNADLYVRRRWRRVQYLTNVFWSRWRREFLNNLQYRKKWKTPQRNVRVGDVVLLSDDAPRNSWPLARITDVEQDDQGQVRSVTLNVGGKKVYRRPVHKLILLSTSDA